MANVTIYTKPGCPYCAAAKENLEREGVKFEEIDVYSVPGALEKMLELTNGVRRVPVIVKGDQVIVGAG